MVTRAKLHEKESIEIVFARPVDGSSIISHFLKHGAKLEDDFFFEPRAGKVPPWQASDVYSVSCSLAGSPVYPNESQVDHLTFDYLFVSTPVECFGRLLQILEHTVEHFQGVAQYKGARISSDALARTFRVWQEELAQELGEQPGSESLAILIRDLFYRK